MNKLTGFIMMFAVAALMAVPVLAQTSSQGEREHKVYQIKHQKAADMLTLLPRSQGTINEKFNTISLDAVPDVHEIIAAILEKYDIPDAPEKTIEFQFFLIKAFASAENAERLQEAINAAKTEMKRLNDRAGITADPQERNKIIRDVSALETVISVQSRKLSALNDGLKDELPEKVRIALNEVAGLTRYKSFELMDAPFLRCVDGSDADISGRGLDGYRINMRRVKIIGESDKRQINIGNFTNTFTVMSLPSLLGYSMTMDGSGITYTNVGINSGLELTEGEMTVIGTSQGLQVGVNSEPYSIIMIVTAKIL